jgi:ferric-dicitrate binding protein FerR (iron transport regulator)
MNADQFSWLLSKELQGNLTAEERAVLEAATAADPELAAQRRMLLAFWQRHEDEQDQTRTTRQAFSRLVDNIKQADPAQWTDPETPLMPLPEYKQAHSFRWLKAAAIFLLLAGSAWLLTLNFRQQQAPAPAQLASKHNNKGDRSRIMLTDGSVVWLNADSELKYPESFDGSKERKVFLTGEAFFEVAPNAEKPFLISTSKMIIRVLGTSFNVKSYPDDAKHETTLVSGAIEVVLADRPDARIRLKPNEKLVIPNTPPDTVAGSPQPALMISRPTYFPDQDSAMIETAWKENQLLFRSERFEDLALQMERWYNVEIEFRDKDLADLRFTGIFRNEKLETALKALQLTEPFKYKIDNGHVVIY